MKLCSYITKPGPADGVSDVSTYAYPSGVSAPYHLPSVGVNVSGNAISVA